jgi:hypothetical protein
MITMPENKPGRTKAIPSDDPHNDLRVIWSSDGKTILSDRRKKD